MPQSYSIVTTAGLQNLAGSRSEWTYAAVNEELAKQQKPFCLHFTEKPGSLWLPPYRFICCRHL